MTELIFRLSDSYIQLTAELLHRHLKLKMSKINPPSFLVFQYCSALPSSSIIYSVPPDFSNSVNGKNTMQPPKPDGWESILPFHQPTSSNTTHSSS